MVCTRPPKPPLGILGDPWAWWSWNVMNVYDDGCLWHHHGACKSWLQVLSLRSYERSNQQSPCHKQVAAGCCGNDWVQNGPRCPETLMIVSMSGLRWIRPNPEPQPSPAHAGPRTISKWYVSTIRMVALSEVTFTVLAKKNARCPITMSGCRRTHLVTPSSRQKASGSPPNWLWGSSLIAFYNHF